MIRILCLIFTLTFLSISYGSEFETTSIKGWEKEELAHDHLRFTHSEKKEIVLHLQVDTFDKDHFWNEKTLAIDIADMAAIRKGMSFFLGTTDYKIESYKLDSKNSTHPRLILTGSYHRLGGQLILFSEINFYHKEHFLQLKIISEGSLPSEKEIESLINEINPTSVDIE